MQVSFPGQDGHQNTLTVESVDSTVGDLMKKIHQQLSLDEHEEVLITWGPHRLVSDQSIESFLDVVQSQENADVWQMTIHVL